MYVSTTPFLQAPGGQDSFFCSLVCPKLSEKHLAYDGHSVGIVDWMNEDHKSEIVYLKIN